MPENIPNKPNGSESGAWNDMDPSAESGENNEVKEALEVIDSSTFTNVFDAADSMGKPITNVFDVYDWSDEDKINLANRIKELTKTEDEPEDDDSAAAGVVAGAAVGAAAGAVAGGEAGSSDTNTGEAGIAANAEKERRFRRLRKFGAGLLLAAGTLAAITFMSNSGSNNKSNEPMVSTEMSMDNEDETEAETEASTEEETTAEDEENLEKLGFQDNYDYWNNIERKSSHNAWMNAGDYMADLINKGKVEVVEKDGKYELANKDDAYRVLLASAFAENREQAGTYMAYANAEAGLFSDWISEGKIRAGEEACEKMSEEDQQKVIAEWVENLKGAKFEEVILNGVYENNYIFDKSNNSHIENMDDAGACYTKTNENNMKALKITFENGGSFLAKINLDDIEISNTKEGFVVILHNADGSEWRYCCQPMVPEGTPINEGTPEQPENPAPAPEAPTPTAPAPEAPTPTAPAPEAPTPTAPAPEPETKAPFVQEIVEEGLDGLTVDVQPQTDAVEEVKPTMAPFPGSTEAAAPETTAAVKETVAETATAPVVAPDSNVQVGAQDTNELSNDGSGRTVKEVSEQAEAKGGIDEKNKEVNTSKQTNRMEEDQKRQESEAAAEQKAKDNYNKIAEENGERAVKMEDGSIQMRNDNGEKSNQELNNMFDNGDI